MAPLPWVEFRLKDFCVVVLDKTPSTSSGRKFKIGRLTSSILNPSNLMLTELQKSMTSIDSFKKDVSLWSRPKWNHAGGDQRCPRGNCLKRGQVPGVNPGSLRRDLQQERLDGTKRQRCSDHERAWKDSTPAVSVHAPNVDSTARKDLSYLTCFNSDKNGHYATKSPKPKKNRDTSED